MKTFDASFPQKKLNLLFLDISPVGLIQTQYLKMRFRLPANEFDIKQEETELFAEPEDVTFKVLLEVKDVGYQKVAGDIHRNKYQRTVD